MSKYVTNEAMRTAMTLQKGYIDQGDSNNATKIEYLRKGKNMLRWVLTGGEYDAFGWGSTVAPIQNPAIHALDVNDGVFSIKEAGDNYFVSPPVQVEEGKTYTFSFYLNGGTYDIRVIGSQNNHQIQSGSGGTTSFTFTSVATETVLIFVSTSDKKLKYPQLELGSSFTEFVASTEDLKKYIDQGDKANAEAQAAAAADIESLKKGKKAINLLTGVLLGTGWSAAPEAVQNPTLHDEVRVQTPGEFQIKNYGLPDYYLVSPQVRVEEGKTYTFSFYGGGGYSIYVIGSSNNHVYSGGAGTGYRDYTFTSVATEEVRIFIGVAGMRYPQLELGSSRTEFTASTEEMKELIGQTSDKVDTLLLSAQYFVAKYSKGTNDYTEISHQGQKDILNKFGFVLLDTTDNANTTTKARRLKDNNLFRFEDGSFAPTVGIKTAQYNQCMANDVYTEESGTYTKVYDAGAFDAAAQWEIDKALIKAGNQAQNLYISDGNGGYQLVTHVLRPWETKETKYTIGIANLVDLYLLDNQVGKSGDYWKGIFPEPIIWDGIDLTKRKLPPTAISPGPVTIITNNGQKKARNFFYLYQGTTSCQSNQGMLPNHDFYEADRTYPNTGEVNIWTNLQRARNNNAEVNNPYPFAEGGYFATNVFITALELAAGTRYIHKADLFGTGISSNDVCNVNSFFTSGGIRFKRVGDVDWRFYRTFSENSYPLSYKSGGYYETMSKILSNNNVFEQCMESQMAASMATELGINPTTDINNPNYFPFYGNTYYYMNVPGFDGLQEGRMNARVYKYTQKTVSAFYEGAAADFDMEIIYRMSLFNGANLSGDICAYNGGGLEMVVTINKSSELGNPVDIYIEPDQTKWVREAGFTKSNLGTFSFEALYEKVISTTNLGNNYTRTRGGYTPFKTADASVMAQGECYYQADRLGWTGSLNERTRLSQLFRGSAFVSNHSPRRIDVTHEASYTYSNISGTLQALIEL